MRPEVNGQEARLELDDLEIEYDHYKNNEQLDDQQQGVGHTASGPLQDSKKGDLVKESEVRYYGSSSSDTLYGSIPSYEETPVTLKEYYNHFIRERLTVRSAGEYAISIFPIIKWMPHYNWAWGYADIVAGVTVGCVLVPQSMSYAQIAGLSPQYGLYSSFVGAFIYSLFATSKDVCIGPVAVMSLQTAKVVTAVLAKYPDNDPVVTAPVVATALSLLCGIVATGVGVLRLGFLVELISLNAVAGFMTGSAFNIIWGQVPALMGYSKLVNTREATYKVVINTLKHLPNTKLDAVFGLIPLFILYLWKWWCGIYGPKLADRFYAHDPKKNRILKSVYFYTQAMRNAVVIIVFTAISWRITRGKKKEKRPIKVLGTVPSGLKDVGVMKLPDGLLGKMAPEIPASIIVLLLEHIAISKSFGRVNDYKVVPDQELIAIGVTNLIGTFFNAYPATGSFSRSALKAKCEVRTPFSGVFTGCCVLIAIYCLTDAFFYIPSATLSAVIIHAVSDLLASYKTTWNFWKMNPLDCLAFVVTVFITVFSSIENGIYFAMCWSAAILLLKQAFPSGRFLGRVEVAEVLNPAVQDDVELDSSLHSQVVEEYGITKTEPETSNKLADQKPSPSDLPVSAPASNKFHTRWVPFDHGYSRELNPDVRILPPPPGVLVYRLSDSFTYINCSRHYDIIFDYIKSNTRRGQLIHLRKKSDRPWNDPGEWEAPGFLKNLFKRKKNVEDVESLGDGSIEAREKPLLKIVCLDFSQVVQVDSTAIQSLVDLRKAVHKYADRQVEFHFAGIMSSWVKRSLVSMEFGTINEAFSDESIIAGHSSYHIAKNSNSIDNASLEYGSSADSQETEILAATGTNMPFFHIEIPDFSKWNI